MLVTKGTTFSSRDMLIDVDVMMMGSTLEEILFSLESKTVSSALFLTGSSIIALLSSFLIDLIDVRIDDGSAMFLIFPCLDSSLASLFLDSKKLWLIAAFSLFNFPWN